MIRLRELRRIARDLQRASRLLNRHYPAHLQDWGGDAPDMETLRNLDTALAQIPGWITFRVGNRTDPYLVSTPSEQQEGEIRGDFTADPSPASRSPRQSFDGKEG